MGLHRFMKHAAIAGIDGVLVLDLPIEEAEALRTVADRCGYRYHLSSQPDDDERAHTSCGSLGEWFPVRDL